VYVALNVSLPTASDAVGIVIVAEPPSSVVAAEVKFPPVSVTVPVGAGLPVPPLTVTVSESD
jgi:hypothetical protein